MFLSPFIKSALNYLPDGFYLPVPAGAMRGVKWISKSANPGQVIGRYEPEQTAILLGLLQDSRVFWDVGAHAGWYSLLAAKRMTDGRVLCFEPNPENLSFIKHHVVINNMDNVEVFGIALGKRTGSSNFSGNAQFGRLSAEGEQCVRTATADSICERPDAIPDLVKIDIEGGEIEFLQGATALLRKHQPTLLLSTHGYLNRDACKSILCQAGYATELIVNNPADGDYVFLARAKAA